MKNEVRITVVGRGREVPATLGLGVVDVTSELVGLTSRGVAYWEPIFRALGLKFDRVMTFDRFSAAVQRYAATDCSIVPHIDAMAPGVAKGFLCAAYGNRAEILSGLREQLGSRKTRRVTFITKAAVGAQLDAADGDTDGDIISEQELAALFTPEVLGRKRLARRLRASKTRTSKEKNQ